MKHFIFCIILTFSLLYLEAKEKPVSLAGEWRFEIADANNQAFARILPGKIQLPGTIDDAGLGSKNTSKPTLEGPYRKSDYAGPAYYQRDIEIPAVWAGKRVTLFLERCRWTTKVWIDDKYVGTQESLIAPHFYDFGTGLVPGKHRLTICVDNSVKLNLGRFVSALFGGTWGNMNGIVGRIELGTTPPVWIKDVQVYPNIAKKTALVKVNIGNATGKVGSGAVNVGKKNVKGTWDAKGGQIEVEVDMSGAKLWDEFSPNLSEVTVKLGDDERTVRFGMREFSSKGTQFTLNGRPIYLRGTLECSVWPLTGYPPTDVPAWQHIYRIMKSYGLNHMRFHSWCPPDAAFAAADIEGIILQAEAPQANVTAGSDPARDAFIEAELMRIVDTYGNHPSFCTMTLGNEYGGTDEVLSRWVNMLIKQDSRHLYSSASAAQKTENRQFTVTPQGRGIGGQGTSRDLNEVVINDSRPTIGHEIAQWMYYPDFKEILKWSGVMALRNYEMIRDDLEKKHQLDLAPKYVQASGEFATLLYKEEIEVLLRTPGYGGFSLLDLHDYPTQGTALVGPLDAFWDSKGFITPAVFSQFCSQTVPLLRMPKRAYTIDEAFKATVDLAHFGSTDITNAQVVWIIKDEHGKIVDKGKLKTINVATGKLTPLGDINASLVSATVPCKLTVTISLDGTKFSNEWNIWAYPAKVEPRPSVDVTVCDKWEVAKEMLEKGKKVVFFAHKITTPTSFPGKFLPVFWSPVWFPMQKPNTMGLLCEPNHSLFAKFPTEFYTNWQWYNLMEHSRLFILNETPASYRPIVQVIDNFERNDKLGVVFEAKVGNGKLLVCGIDLTAVPDDASSRQFLASLYAYTGSEAFNPTQELRQKILDKLFVPAFSRISSDSSEFPGRRDQTFQTENAIDGDPITFWQSQSKAPVTTYPHKLILELTKSMKLSGLTCLPAQTPAIDAKNIRQVGWIKDYVVYVSNDGENWGDPVVKGTFSYDESLKTILFSKSVETKFVKFVAVTGFDVESPIASLAEISILLEN